MPREFWDAPYRLLEGPNQWPDDTVPELGPLVEQWAELLSGIGRELTRAIAMALALPEDHFDQYFAGQPHWFGKLIHYVGAADGADSGTPTQKGAYNVSVTATVASQAAVPGSSAKTAVNNTNVDSAATG